MPKNPWCIEAALGQVIPGLRRQNFRINFLFPEHFQGLSLGVIIQAGHADQSGVGWIGGLNDFFDQILPLADSDALAGLWNLSDLGHLKHPTNTGDHAPAA